jgi:hypothetical protein
MALPTTIAEAGRIAVATALAAWERCIVDPRKTVGDDESRTFIDTIIRSPSQGLGWPRCSQRVEAYRINGDFEWCGAFAAHAWRAAGLDRRLAFASFASTFRLDGYGRYKRVLSDSAAVRAELAFPKPDSDGRLYLHVSDETKAARVQFLFAPQPGDILMCSQVRHLPKYRFGHHIAIIERWDPERGEFHTIEGNAQGLLKNGKRGEGVVRQVRKLGLADGDGPTAWRVRRLIRPSIHDLTGE